MWLTSDGWVLVLAAQIGNESAKISLPFYLLAVKSLFSLGIPLHTYKDDTLILLWVIILPNYSANQLNTFMTHFLGSLQSDERTTPYERIEVI